MAYGIGNPFWYYLQPEFQLEGNWGLKIQDNYLKNTFPTWSTKFFGVLTSIDDYVQSVTIPQLTLNYETNDFNMINFKEKSPYDDVTITFYDDIKGTCMSFFNTWMKYIYDEKSQALLSNWRYEAKDLIVTYFREFYTGVKASVQYTLNRCLPKGISEVSADNSGGERKTFTVTLACQKVVDTTLKDNPFQNVFLQKAQTS